MSERVIQRRKLRKVSSGDLRDPIVISLKAILAPVSSSVAPVMSFSDLTFQWAKTETKERKELFSGTQLLGIRTHVFTIRYPSEVITSDHAVLFNDNIYDVLSTQDFEERHEYLVLNCGEKGPDNLASNYQ